LPLPGLPAAMRPCSSSLRAIWRQPISAIANPASSRNGGGATNTRVTVC